MTTKSKPLLKFADAVGDAILTERKTTAAALAARDASIAQLRESLNNASSVIDGLLEGARNTNKELGAFRRRLRDVEDRIERKAVTP